MCEVCKYMTQNFKNLKNVYSFVYLGPQDSNPSSKNYQYVKLCYKYYVKLYLRVTMSS